MSISLKTIKMLWGRSGNKCAICKDDLVVDPIDTDDDESVIGEMAHIVARKENFTRGNYDNMSITEKDKYSNLILLCQKHHKIIDDQPEYYTAEKLREIKKQHEEWVRSQLSPDDLVKQRDDEVYASYIQKWMELIDIENWTARGTWICSAAGPQMLYDDYIKWNNLSPWIISRVWPRRYVLMEAAFFNFKSVMEDFLKVFSRYSERRGEDEKEMITRRFYQIPDWDPPRYDKLCKKYEEHVDLVTDLFAELTRAANYVCDQVRQYLFPSFRIKEGVLLIERGMVGWELRTEYNRVEYRGTERTERPYPGLDKFKEIRYTRDFSIDPGPPKPPKLEEY